MDPLGNQPAQPNPQQPPVVPLDPSVNVNPAPAVSPQPQQSVAPKSSPAPTEPSRPEPATQNITPPLERPVEAWPPAGTPAAAEVAQASVPITEGSSNQPTPTEAQTIGTEVSEAAGAIPSASTEPTPPPIAPAPGGMDGFVTPIAKEIRDSVNTNSVTSSEPTMSDQQADKLFQEEPATKARKKHAKIKKVIVSLLLIALLSVIAGGAYIFYFGNKAAQSYVDTASTTAYKEAFSQIQTALGEQPVNKAELEAGFNKLKVAQSNSQGLSPVVLGQLNPNYKKAQQASEAGEAYRAKAEEYQEKYAEYAEFLATLSTSLALVSEFDDLPSIDLTTTPAEKLSADLNALLTKCNDSVRALAEVSKPGELSEDTAGLSKNLALICTESTSSLEDGVITLLVGKTGILSASDQEAAKEYLVVFTNTSTNIANAETGAVNLQTLTDYQQSALDEAKELHQEAEATAS